MKKKTPKTPKPEKVIANLQEDECLWRRIPQMIGKP